MVNVFNFPAPLLWASADASAHPILTISLALGVGIALTALSQRLNLPTIVLLLVGGFVMGPEVLGWVRPDSLGDILPVVVSLAIGIILFEGGLTLNLRDYTHASTIIRRLLTIGVLVTWLGGAATLWLLFGFPFEFAMLAASLVIVTGPTVIVPLLKRIKAVPRVASILHWEGVLIDAIGVFIAVLCFEWVVVGEGGMAMGNFMIRVVVGAALGLGGGWLIEWVISRRWVPEGLTNGFALASGIMLFGLSEAIISESGLLAVTLAGLYMGWKSPAELREIRSFKAEITDLMIAMLFILLVARLEVEQFLTFGWPGVVAVLVMMFVVRPISVLLCSAGVDIPWKEKAFLAYIAPRGIVAASLASLFALSLAEKKSPLGDPAFLETFTYSIICATVIIQGFSAGWVGRLLGLRRPDPVGWLIVGAHTFGRALAELIERSTGQPVVLIDSNLRNVNRAREEDFQAFHEDALDAESLLELDEFQSVGHVLALTDNVELNQLIATHWSRHVGRYHVFAWKPNPPAIPVAAPTVAPPAASPRIETTSPHAAGRGAAPASSNRQAIGPVFGDVARPSVVSGEIERREAEVTMIPLPPNQPMHSGINTGHPLVLIRGREVLMLVNDSAIESQSRPGDQVIMLHRSTAFLRRALQHGAYVEPEGSNLHEVYMSLAALAAEIEPRLSVQQIRRDLEEQIETFPAILGNGVAVPHLYSDAITERICLLAHTTVPVDCPGHSEPVRLVFFIISPAGDSEGHLGTLAEIARCCLQQENLAGLTTAQSLDDLLKIV